MRLPGLGRKARKASSLEAVGGVSLAMLVTNQVLASFLVWGSCKGDQESIKAGG